MSDRVESLPRPVSTFWRAGEAYLEAAGSRKASQLAFHLLLAAPAALVFAIWILSLLDGSGQVRGAIVEAVVESLPLAGVVGENEVRDILNTLGRGAGTLGLVAIPVLLYSTSSALAAMRFAVESANGGRPDDYSFLRMRGQDLLLVLTGMPALVTIALLAVTTSVGLEIGRAPLVGRFLYSIAGPILLSVFGVTSLIVLLRLLDLGRSTIRGAIWGGLVAGGLCIAISWGLSTWFELTGGGSLIYGILAAFMGLMIFAYLIANAIVYGAYVAAEINKPDPPA